MALSGCGGGSSGSEANLAQGVNAAPSEKTHQALSPTGVLLQKAAQLSTAELQRAESAAERQPNGRSPLPASDEESLAKANKSTADERTNVFRFFNANTSGHFFTASTTERDQVRVSIQTMRYEGAAFSAHRSAGAGLDAVHRFYNRTTGMHLYTISADEKRFVQANLPVFTYEGVAYYASKTAAADRLPLHRFYLPGAGFHFYTASDAEMTSIRNTLPQYTYEGVAYYVQPAESDVDTWPEVVKPTIPTSSYTLEPWRWGVASNASNATATTDGMQAAIDWASSQGIGQFRVPAGEYLLGKIQTYNYAGGIKLPSNMALVLEPGAVLRMVPNDRWNYCVVTINGKKNVSVSGGTIVGDRYNHTYTPSSSGGTAHDEGHAICIEGSSQYVEVQGVYITQANGDGILIVGKAPSTPQDITITGNNFDTNRRQGISIVGGARVLIEGNQIHHTKGTSPQFGIDIEPLGGYLVRDVIIRGNNFHHNRGGDVVNTRGFNILIEGNTMHQGEASTTGGDDGRTYIDGPIVFWPEADQTIRNNNITMLNGSYNGKSGIIGYARPGRTRSNPDYNVIHNNVCNGCGMYLYSSGRADIRDNQFLNGYIVIQNFEDAHIFNNAVTYPNRCWAYRFRNVTGQAAGNTYNAAAFDIPLSAVPFNGCWVN
ncbi:hypothetical protein LPB72_17110 [Hydrogenophaga crassostreae]|uniref:Uncharacterized protein n=1 Tax=Hydrogenophaga crassostreae TaxID=1763535 RepID=A0A167HAM4_9BURK|nr:hypothetical protein LPB072_07630 [Hydrogenophaga crassostreae]OAD40606.1 hypothetical protein LPB72_17110 [Hydrogenophaga crassostreae]